MLWWCLCRKPVTKPKQPQLGISCICKGQRVPEAVKIRHGSHGAASCFGAASCSVKAIPFPICPAFPGKYYSAAAGAELPVSKPF